MIQICKAVNSSCEVFIENLIGCCIHRITDFNLKDKARPDRLKQILFTVERSELYAKSAALSWRSFMRLRYLVDQ